MPTQSTFTSTSTSTSTSASAATVLLTIVASLGFPEPTMAADGDSAQHRITEEVIVKRRKPSESTLETGTTSSGVYYEILRQGTGSKPHNSDTVRVHYVGAFENGEQFDNSRERGEPIVIPISSTIRGWQDALVLMPVGSLWKLHVPSRLAYGTRGAGSVIPPNTDLTFEVELIRIE